MTQLTKAQLTEALHYCVLYNPFPAGDDERDVVVQLLNMVLSEKYILIKKEVIKEWKYKVSKVRDGHVCEGTITCDAIEQSIKSHLAEPVITE